MTLTTPALPRPGSPGAWLLAARPKTLPVSVAPVILGTSLAALEGRLRPGLAVLALLGALFLQLVSNLVNDLADARRGADGSDRRGPPRAVALGLLPPAAVARAALVLGGLALAVGSVLVVAGGWPILVIGLAALGAAVAYTAGPWPLGYHGLGDLFVFVFFGPVAVAGTHYVQAGHLGRFALILGAGVGALATAVLVVNNLRDLDGDRRAKKRTLAVRLGRGGTLAEYLLLTGLAYFAVAISGCLASHPPGTTPGRGLWLAMLGVLWAAPLCRRLVAAQSGPELNRILERTAQQVLLYAVLAAGGAWLFR